MLKNVFSFTGRIGRSEFIMSIGIFIFISVIIVSMMMKNRDMETIGSLLMLPTIWFYLAQGAKRARDMGKSPYLCILLIVPSLIVSILSSDVSGNLKPLSGLATLGVIIWFSVAKSVDNNMDNSDTANSNYYNPNPPSRGSRNGYTGGYDGGHNNGSGNYTSTSYGQPNGQNAQSSPQYGSPTSQNDNKEFNGGIYNKK